ncbi:hypothetical protein [Herpetosiphon geysericola]|uniref:3-keto-disaccharide hydrolase domain-containing protein n=1 Tax=Herpetosiphon geysericola TaxID=70996 RepID=A0A0N8GPP4_9CHLR|nr:hypothetical protein [Herpetosiphon geysericola]KPL81466.1 hypothetical protein SE18_22815 [Herpetosiphon geysericola]
MKPFRWLSIGVLCSVLLGCAATVQPTATPTTMTNLQEAWHQWPVVLTDSFRDNRNKWMAGPFQYDNATGSMDVGPELYRMEMKGGDSLIYSSVAAEYIVDREKGFYASIDAKSFEKVHDTYGLLFLSQAIDNSVTINKATNFYYFEIIEDCYRLLYTNESEWKEIITLTSLPEKSQKEFNRLAVVVKDKTIMLLFNGLYLTDIEVDDLLKLGTIGVICGAYGANVTQVCEFDNLEVRKPE